MGRIRQSNEDGFVIDRDTGLFLVADGMGGHNAGEVASQLAIDTIRAFLARSQDGQDCTWPYGIDPKLSFDGNRLRNGIMLANRRVFKASEAREEYTGMGSTAAVALVQDDRMTFASIGDSRIYRYAGGELVQLTSDDTWGNRLRTLESGGIVESMAQSPMNNVLTKVLGASDETELDVFDRTLAAGDRVLLCTDGLHNLVGADELCGIIAGEPDVATAVELLIRKALDAGGRDNITAVLVEYTA
jgi:protein phosphatase